MKSTNSNPILTNLESIRQQELKKQVNRDLKNEASHQRKTKATQWVLLFTLFTFIVLCNIVFNFGLLVFMFILMIAIFVLSDYSEQAKPLNNSFDLKGYNTHLLNELRNSVLPNSLPTKEDTAFKSSILRSKLIRGNVQLLDRFKGQTT